MRTRIKFCGMQHEADVLRSVDLGVDAIGCIFAPSPRRIELEQAQRIAAILPPFVTLVGVFVDHNEAELLSILQHIPRLIPQFCGHESVEYCQRVSEGASYLKVFHIHDEQTFSQTHLAQYPGLAVFDTQQAGLRGGTGKTFSWKAFDRPKRPFILAGGLTPENVSMGITTLHPYGVDVRSGIETHGRKDFHRMQAFVEAVRSADKEGLHATG